MDSGFSIQGAVLEVLRELARGAVAYAPRLVTGAIVLVIGWLLASLARWVVSTALHRAGADAALERAGLLDSFRRIGIPEPSRVLLPAILFWLTVLVFVQSAARMVGLEQIAAGVQGFFAFLPNLFSAGVILLLGNAFGQFLGRAVTTYARDSGLAFAQSLGAFISGFALFVVAIIAMGQLQIDTRILNILTIVVFSGLALGFGLTFGLGTRDTTRNLVAGFYARRLFGAGQQVEIAGERGRVRTISAMQTVLERDDQTIALPNTHFLDHVVRRDDAISS
jgi:hypothetical protein